MNINPVEHVLIDSICDHVKKYIADDKTTMDCLRDRIAGDLRHAHYPLYLVKPITTLAARLLIDPLFSNTAYRNEITKFITGEPVHEAKSVEEANTALDQHHAQYCGFAGNHKVMIKVSNSRPIDMSHLEPKLRSIVEEIHNWFNNHDNHHSAPSPPPPAPMLPMTHIRAEHVGAGSNGTYPVSRICKPCDGTPSIVYGGGYFIERLGEQIWVVAPNAKSTK